jgi:hypothetical protein
MRRTKKKRRKRRDSERHVFIIEGRKVYCPGSSQTKSARPSGKKAGAWWKFWKRR